MRHFYFIVLIGMNCIGAAHASKLSVTTLLGSKVDSLDRFFGKPVLVEKSSPGMTPQSTVYTYALKGFYLSVDALNRNRRVYRFEIFSTNDLSLETIKSRFTLDYRVIKKLDNYEFKDKNGKSAFPSELLGIRGLPVNSRVYWLKQGTFRGNLFCYAPWKAIEKLN